MYLQLMYSIFLNIMVCLALLLTYLIGFLKPILKRNIGFDKISTDKMSTDIMSNRQNVEQTKCQTDKMPNRQNVNRKKIL